LRVLNNAFDHSLELEETAAMPLGGGIMQHGYQCGMIWGATLAAGAQAYRLFGPGPQTETRAILAAHRLVESFRTRNNTTNCLDITGLDTSSSTRQMTIYFFLKGGVIRCGHMTVRYAQEAFREIHAALAEEPIASPAPPVSCAAMVAEKMGVSAMHTLMVAGLAGGIGLSGGACGALGAAIWIREMNNLKHGAGNFDFQNPRGLATIETFLNCTDAEFECANIVGRRFQNIADHAAFLRDGGCAHIIDGLATVSSADGLID
jgi:hypothetical protein